MFIRAPNKHRKMQRLLCTTLTWPQPVCRHPSHLEEQDTVICTAVLITGQTPPTIFGMMSSQTCWLVHTGRIRTAPSSMRHRVPGMVGSLQVSNSKMHPKWIWEMKADKLQKLCKLRQKCNRHQLYQSSLSSRNTMRDSCKARSN